MSKLPLLATLPLLAIASPSSTLAPELPPPEFTIAFLGDQGLGGDAEAVLRLIRDEGADAVMHLGDFDYHDDPAAWDAQIDTILGPDFPYFASAGNHDEAMVYEPDPHQKRRPGHVAHPKLYPHACPPPRPSLASRPPESTTRRCSTSPSAIKTCSRPA